MGYLGELWKLWRGRRDNPLCQYGWRRRWRVVIAAFLHLLAVGSIVCLYEQPWNSSWRATNKVVDFFLLSPIVLYLLIWLTFFFSSSNWRSVNGLTDLKLSSLSVAEIGYGLVYRPVLRSLLFCLYFFAMAVFLLVCIFADFRFNWYDNLHPFLFMMAGLMLFAPMIIVYQVQSWLTEWNRPLKIFIHNTFRAGIVYLMCFASVALGDELFYAWNDVFEEIEKWRVNGTGFLVVMTVFALFLVLLIKYRSVYEIFRHWRKSIVGSLLCFGLMMIVYLDFFWPQRYWERGPVLILWQDYLFYGIIFILYTVFVFLFARVTLAHLKERIFYAINPIPLFRSTPFAPGLNILQNNRTSQRQRLIRNR